MNTGNTGRRTIQVPTLPSCRRACVQVETNDGFTALTSFTAMTVLCYGCGCVMACLALILAPTPLWPTDERE